MKINIKLIVTCIITMVFSLLTICYAATGAEDDPYVVKDGSVIKYDSIPFYFVVENSGDAGQYKVDWNQANKKVTFKRISTQRVAVAEKTDDINKKYIQAGVGTEELSETIAYPKYKITSKEIYSQGLKITDFIFGGWSIIYNAFTGGYHGEREIRLNNAAFRSESVNGRAQDTTTFTFVESLINASDAYVQDISVSGWRPDGNTQVYIRYCFNGFYDAMEDEGQATGLEALITRILTGIGDLYAELLRGILGTECTIDSIIFNDFEPTKLDFFDSGSIASEVKNVVNTWFRLFTNMAYVIYFIFLVYVGIQVVLNSGKKAYREYINSWVIGLLLLAIMPMCLRYVFKINDAFVALIGSDREKTYSMINYSTDLDINGTAGEDSKTSIVEELMEKKDQLQSEALEELQNLLNDNDASYSKLCRDMEQYIDSSYLQGGPMDSIYIDAYTSISSHIWQIKGSDDLTGDATINSNVETLYRVILRSSKGGEKYSTKEEIENDLHIKSRIYTYAASVKRYFELRTQIGDVEQQIEAATSGTDLMGDMRMRAGKTYRLAYALVYLFMLFQLTFLLILYYKRIFVIAMLIIIFPLVMATYVKDKTADGKADILTTWWKEFFANVFVQMIHAVIYVILIEAGLNIYKANPNNWLVFLLSILFLFPAEAILRSVLGLQSSTLVSLKGTIGRAAVGIGAGVAVARSLGNGKSKDEQEAEAKKKKAEEERKKKRAEEKNKQEETNKKKREAQKTRYRANTQTMTGAGREKYQKKLDRIQNKDNEKDEKRQKKLDRKNKRAERRKLNGKSPKVAFKDSKKYKLMKMAGSDLKHLVKGARRVYGAAIGASSALAGGGSPSDFIAGSAAGTAIGGVTGKWKNYDKEDSKYSARSARRREKVQKALDQRNVNQGGTNASSTGGYASMSGNINTFATPGETTTYTKSSSGNGGKTRIRLNVTQQAMNVKEDKKDEK